MKARICQVRICPKCDARYAPGFLQCPNCGSLRLYKEAMIENHAAPRLLPMSGRIVVEALKEETTPAGIFLPATAFAEQRTTVGKVVQLPVDFYSSYLEEGESYNSSNIHLMKRPKDLLKIGDIVLFGQNSGMLIDIGYGRERTRAIILRESEVLAKVLREE